MTEPLMQSVCNSIKRADLMNPRKEMSDRLTTQPAVAKARGMVSAPVPTIRLNMYTSPTCQSTAPTDKCSIQCNSSL